MSKYTREEILKLIQENGGPTGLDLSGKDLSGIDLGREAIAAELEKAREKAPDEIPVWFSGRTGGIDLHGADLRGTILWSADLRGAFLWSADLRGAFLWSADLQGAFLWSADLQGAFLGNADLREADVDNARLQGAELRATDLRGAILWSANLQGAYLQYSHLEKVDLFAAESLAGAYFYNAFLDGTRMKRCQLGEKIGEERKGKHDEAKEAYLALKNNFAEIGRYEDSAWAYRKERRMEKLEVLQKAKDACQEHDWRWAIPRYGKVAVDQLVELVCDYGESVPRVLCSLVAVYVLFTLIYGLTWSVIRVHATPAAITREPTRNLVDLARFSLGAMTTMDLTGLEPRNGLVELLTGFEALLGIALTGLLGFVAGNRIRRS